MASDEGITRTMYGNDPNGNDNGGSTSTTFATTTTTTTTNTTTVQPTLSPLPPPPPLVFAILDVHALDGFFWNVFHAKLNAIVHELWPPLPEDRNETNDHNRNNHRSNHPNNAWFATRPPSSWLSNLYRRMGLVPLLLQGAYYLWNANSTTTTAATPAARVLGLHLVTNNNSTTTSSNHHPRHQFLQRYLLYVVLLCASPIVYDQWTDWIHHLGQRRQQQLEQELVSPAGPTLEEEDAEDDDQEEEEDEVDVDHNETEPIQATRTTRATAPRQRQQRHEQEQQQAHQKRLALQRQWQTVQVIQKILDLVVPMARLLLLLSCWNHRTSSSTAKGNNNHHNHKNNRCSPPPPLAMTTDLAMWLSGLAYTQQQEQPTEPPPPKLQVSLAHRRYLWELLEQCGRLWILDGLSHWPVVWARWVVGGNANQTTTTRRTSTKTRAPSPQRREQQQRQQTHFCPYCRTHQDDIVVPVQTTHCCHQVYCYTCLYQALRQRQEEQEQRLVARTMTMVDYHQNLGCLQCGQGVVRLQPIVVDNHTNDHSTTNNSGQDNNDPQDHQDPTNSCTGRVCVVLEGAQRIIPGSWKKASPNKGRRRTMVDDENSTT